jgi:hypothetical protein
MPSVRKRFIGPNPRPAAITWRIPATRRIPQDDDLAHRWGARPGGMSGTTHRAKSRGNGRGADRAFETGVVCRIGGPGTPRPRRARRGGKPADPRRSARSRCEWGAPRGNLPIAVGSKLNLTARYLTLASRPMLSGSR